MQQRQPAGLRYGRFHSLEDEPSTAPLMRRRGELVVRSFAHCYDRGGMRRTHLRKHDNFLKRLLLHVAGFNLSLVLRKVLGLGTARGLQGLTAAALRRLAARYASTPGG